MKKLLFLFLMLTCTIAFAQEENDVIDDTSNFLAKVIAESSSLSQSTSIGAKILEFLPKDEIVTAFEIVDHPQLSNYKYVGVYKDTVLGYVPLKDLFIPKDKLDYLYANKGNTSVRKENAKNTAILVLLDKIERLKSKFDAYDKVGLVITKKEYAFQEYSDAFGLDLEFYNGYSRPIKYIDITVRPYNRVGDLTKDDFGRDVQRVQVIGPLNSKKISDVTFNNMFWDESDTIEYLVITYMKITFMDNSVKELKNINPHLGEGVFNGK